VDPMMSGTPQPGAAATRSFHEIDELPPLKTVYTPPPPPPPAKETAHVDAVHAAVFKNAAPETPKVQPREVAKKAVAEIKKTPPKLFMVSMAAAVGIILLILAVIAWRIHSENADEDVTPAQPAATAIAQPAQAPPTVAAAGRAAPEPEVTAPRAVSVEPKYNPKKKTKARPAAPAIVAGQLSVSSTPAGAQVQIDGKNDSS